MVLTPCAASPSSTVGPVLVPRTLLVSFPLNKRLRYQVVSAFTDIYGRKGLVFGRRAKASIEDADDNGYHDSTIKELCPLSMLSFRWW